MMAGRALRIGALALWASGAAWAGPPFVTDDPEPTETGHFESYLFTAGSQAGGGFSGTGVGVEVNYGPFADTQLTASLPFDFESPPHSGTGFGLGDAALSVKYRFIEEDDDGWRPQVAVFPEIDIPLRHAAGKNTREFFPVWAQKSFGDWTSFGGGGYWINPGPGNQNYWQVGWAVLRKMAPNFSAGAEIFRQTADTTGGRPTTSIGIGMLYDLSDAFHIVGSANTGIENHRDGNGYSYFVALEWTR